MHFSRVIEVLNKEKHLITSVKMFSICKQTHPATGIEFSITCRFFNNFEENIVTGGANILKVFRIIPDVDPTNTTDKFSGKV